MQARKILFRDFKAGEVIFTQGEEGNCAYIIEEGRVQISLEKSGDSFPVSIMGVGEIFGEMAILDGLPRAGTARCLENTRLCVVSSDQLYNRIHHSDPVCTAAGFIAHQTDTFDERKVNLVFAVASCRPRA